MGLSLENIYSKYSGYDIENMIEQARPASFTVPSDGILVVASGGGQPNTCTVVNYKNKTICISACEIGSVWNYIPLPVFKGMELTIKYNTPTSGYIDFIPYK